MVEVGQANLQNDAVGVQLSSDSSDYARCFVFLFLSPLGHGGTEKTTLVTVIIWLTKQNAGRCLNLFLDDVACLFSVRVSSVTTMHDIRFLLLGQFVHVLCL